MSPILSERSKVILVKHGDVSAKVQSNIFYPFVLLGVSNFAIIHENNGHQVATVRQTQKKIMQLYNVTYPPVLFPDPSTVLKTVTYRIVIYQQIPRLRIDNNSIVSPLTYFIRAISQKQKAIIRFIILKDLTRLAKYYAERQMDLTLNTG